MSLLIIAGLSKSYGAPVLQQIDLRVESGEILCLLGPSGCGKTTLLRIVAGLEEADEGSIRFDGAALAPIPVHRRGFGLMFQEFALFPHLTVAENIAFGLQMAGWERPRQRQRVAEMLALVNLEGYDSRSIFELSGGERQRVALARSLAPSPRLLMLDEPLGSLDRTLREELMGELRRILKRVGVTALYVTHDQTEAFALADRVGVMNRGRFEQIAPPEELYARPATPFVARFLGLRNLLSGEVGSDGRTLETGLGRMLLPEAAPVGPHTLLIRPEIGPENIGGAGDGGRVTGNLTGAEFRGSDYHLQITLPRGDGEAVKLDFILPTRHRRSREERLPPMGGEITIGLSQSQLVLIREPAPAG